MVGARMSVDVAGLAPHGWNPRVEALLADRLDGLVPARVVRVTRTTCRVVTPAGDVVAVAPTLPAVGDWVGIDGADPPVVSVVAEQWSALTRMDPHLDRLQVLAANVDLVLVTCPADRPSIERVERETVLAWDAGAQPVVLVTKADLDDAAALVDALRERLVGVEVLATSARDRAGVEA